jgi:hypothetical protein
MSAFDEWYNGMVGFHINSERIHEDVLDSDPKYRAQKLRKWMVVCWNSAIDAAINEVEDDPFAHHQSNLEKLKEKI